MVDCPDCFLLRNSVGRSPATDTHLHLLEETGAPVLDKLEALNMYGSSDIAF